MPHTPSKVQQQTAVGEGLAIACLALGVDEVPNSKLDLEFAFNHAWQAWPHRSKFPQIRADMERTDILRILDDADGRRWAFVGSWTTDYTTWFPRLKQDNWGWAELADSAGGTFDVDLDGWISLAAPWLDHMGVRHS
ncbi:hypothetical protein ACH9EU_11680 [Kocuria sp. M1R5S2]|uniref:hypothetical protein n=1 Tax=Kocuria rhizosphaerae TaxID=3376285 RepID=UPI00379CA275